MSSNAIERISKARTVLILDHPFFGSLSLRLKIVADEQGAKTKDMATDGDCVFINPAYVERLSDDELVGMMAHVCMHPAMQHHTRRGNRDNKTWQKATDLAINTPLHEAGFKLPIELPLDPRFNGMSAESIYLKLKEEEQDQNDGDDQQQDQNGNGPGGGGGGNGEGDGQDDGQGDAPGQCLDSKDPTQSAADWELAVQQAAKSAQAMGQLPGDLARLVGEANRPRVDWKSLLMRFAQEQCKNDYTFRSPNRRYVPQDVYLPELRDTKMGEIVLMIDSSGSISDKICSKFIGCAQSIAEQLLPAAVRVIICDARVHYDERFEQYELPQFKLKGGGGTDFRPPFKLIDEEDDKPACILYLTDGYGPFPEQPSEVPTLWCMINDDVTAPWGETVRVEVDED